jgi:hypothetical protein
VIKTNETIQSTLVGVWAPVSGNSADTMEYRANGTVRMAMFGGLYHMEGSYRFIQPDTIEIGWHGPVSAEAEEVVQAVNQSLDEQGVTAKLRVVQRSVLQVSVTENELKTLHIEKGRLGHFRRVS